MNNILRAVVWETGLKIVRRHPSNYREILKYLSFPVSQSCTPPVTFSLSLCIPPLFALSLLVFLPFLAPLRYDQLAIAVPRPACLFRPSQTITLTCNNYTITELEQRIE